MARKTKPEKKVHLTNGKGGKAQVSESALPTWIQSGWKRLHPETKPEPDTKPDE